MQQTNLSVKNLCYFLLKSNYYFAFVVIKFDLTSVCRLNFLTYSVVLGGPAVMALTFGRAAASNWSCKSEMVLCGFLNNLQLPLNTQMPVCLNVRSNHSLLIHGLINSNIRTRYLTQMWHLKSLRMNNC